MSAREPDLNEQQAALLNQLNIPASEHNRILASAEQARRLWARIDPEMYLPPRAPASLAWEHSRGAFARLAPPLYALSEIGRAEVKRPSQQLVVLDEFLRRAAELVREIALLLDNGFVSGALSRCRTLEELSVVAMAIQGSPPSLAKAFRRHSAMAMRKLDRAYSSELGEAPINTWLDRYIRALKRHYGRCFAEANGWTLSILHPTHDCEGPNHKKPPLDFATLQAKVVPSSKRFLYLLGNAEVHAGWRTMRDPDFRASMAALATINAVLILAAHFSMLFDNEQMAVACLALLLVRDDVRAILVKHSLQG